MIRKREDPALESFVARRGVFEGIRGKRVGGEPASEQEHFYTCGTCGQAVDKRDLHAVLHHEQAKHEPLPVN